MSNRITCKTLEASVKTLNSVTGRPQGYEKGAFILDVASGGYAICLLLENGGQKTIFSRDSASVIYASITGYIYGFEAGKGVCNV